MVLFIKKIVNSRYIKIFLNDAKLGWIYDG